MTSFLRAVYMKDTFEIQLLQFAGSTLWVRSGNWAIHITQLDLLHLCRIGIRSWAIIHCTHLFVCIYVLGWTPIWLGEGFRVSTSSLTSVRGGFWAKLVENSSLHVDGQFIPTSDSTKPNLMLFLDSYELFVFIVKITWYCFTFNMGRFATWI